MTHIIMNTGMENHPPDTAVTSACSTSMSGILNESGSNVNIVSIPFLGSNGQLSLPRYLPHQYYSVLPASTSLGQQINIELIPSSSVLINSEDATQIHKQHKISSGTFADVDATERDKGAILNTNSSMQVMESSGDSSSKVQYVQLPLDNQNLTAGDLLNSSQNTLHLEIPISALTSQSGYQIINLSQSSEDLKNTYGAQSLSPGLETKDVMNNVECIGFQPTSQHPISDKIFSKVEAQLSSSITGYFGDNVSDISKTFEDCVLEWKKDLDSWSVVGNLGMVQKLKNRLAELLKIEDKIQQNKVDRSTQTDSTNDMKTVAVSCDILVPAMSAYGRGIKQPARFNEYRHTSSLKRPCRRSADNKSKLKSNSGKLYFNKEKKTFGKSSKMIHTGHNILSEDSQSQYTRVVLDSDKNNSIQFLIKKDGIAEDSVSQEGDSIKDEEQREKEMTGEPKVIEKFVEIIQSEDLKESNDEMPDFSFYPQLQEQNPSDESEQHIEDTFEGKPRKKTKREYEEEAPYKFFCTMCSFKTKRQSHFDKHLKVHETTDTIFQCKYCEFKSLRSGVVRRHELLHGKTTRKCTECNYVTYNPKLLLRHFKIKHTAVQPKQREVFYCPKCPYKTVMKRRLTSHLETHSGDVFTEEEASNIPPADQIYKCELCEYTTTRKEHMVRHRSNVHLQQRPYLCDLCGASFKRTDALSIHKLSHVEKHLRNYRFQCKLCQKTFRCNAHLRDHMSMHSPTRQFLCDICGASFKTRACQKKHIKYIHQNPRSYKCDVCSKTFNTKNAAQRHTKVHDSLNNRHQVILDSSCLGPEQVAQLNQIESQMTSQLSSQLTNQGLLGQDGDQTEDISVQDIIIAPNMEVYADANLQNSESATAIMYLHNINI